MTDRIDLNIAEIDAMIADVARRGGSCILPILRGVKSGEIAYVELRYAGARILRLGGPGRLPVVMLVADGEGRGPSSFATVGFLRGLFGRAGGVLLSCDDDLLVYELAAACAAERRAHCVLIECPRSAIEAWASFALDAGVAPNNLVVSLCDDRLPDDELEQMALADIPPAKPRGRLH